MIESSINDILVFYGKERIKVSGKPLLNLIIKIIEHAKVLINLSKDNNISLIQSFYLNGGLSLKNFESTNKVEKIIDKTLAHLNINNENDEKWKATIKQKNKRVIFLYIVKMK